MNNNKKYLLIVLFLAIIILSGCSSNNNIVNVDSYNIQGSVKSLEGNFAVPGAEVTLENNNITKNTITDNSGNFGFQDIGKGSYNIKVSSDDYSYFEKEYYINGDEIINIKLSALLGNSSISGNIYISNKTYYTQITSTNDKDLSINNINVNGFNENNNLISKPYKDSEIIVKYRDQISINSINKLESLNKINIISKIKTKNGEIVKYKIPEGQKVIDMVNYYNNLPEVEWAEPNYISYILAEPNDEYYDYQWNIINTNLEAGWDIEKGDKSVTVAVVDTGIISNHPDLEDNLISGADFVGGNRTEDPSNYNITDLDPTDENTESHGGSHGTYISGIIGAVGNNTIGVSGVNWDINILPVRVIGVGGAGEYWDVAEGIYYSVDRGVDIINFSIGGPDSELLYDAIQFADNADVIMVAAAGNNGVYGLEYPAAYDQTIAVGAVDLFNNITTYSNYGPQVDLVAPGGTAEDPSTSQNDNILNTWGYYDSGNTYWDYGLGYGTSMAVPHVSGVAALLLANGVSPLNVRTRLTSTAVDLGSEGKDDYYGYGLLDAYGALLNKKLSNPYVFAGVESGDYIFLKSEILIMNDDGTYNLNEVASEKVYVYSWRDVNENEIIDSGDYYGRTSETINVTDDSNHNDININIYYIKKDSSIIMNVKE